MNIIILIQGFAIKTIFWWSPPNVAQKNMYPCICGSDARFGTCIAYVIRKYYYIDSKFRNSIFDLYPIDFQYSTISIQAIAWLLCSCYTLIQELHQIHKHLIARPKCKWERTRNQKKSSYIVISYCQYILIFWYFHIWYCHICI